MGGMRGSATAAEAARAKHRGRGKTQALDKTPEKEKAPPGGRAKHRPSDGGRRAAKASRGKHAANS
jgi:hypothetical protein